MRQSQLELPIAAENVVLPYYGDRLLSLAQHLEKLEQDTLALGELELSPRDELLVRITDEWRYFALETTVYRLLKARDSIASSACIIVRAADEFRDKTTLPN